MNEFSGRSKGQYPRTQGKSSLKRTARTRTPLDTSGTSGSLPPDIAPDPRLKNGDPGPHDWHKRYQTRLQVRSQVAELLEGSQAKATYSETWRLNKAASVLNGCGKTYVVAKDGPAQYRYLHSFHCKKKYCPRCARKKRDKMLAKYADFFDGDSRADLMRDYDLAILTVTLRHGPGSRRGWYFDDLKTHFRNALKYGAFKRYIAGGIYTTEVTHGRNGFHIHRHALVLVPKEHCFRDGVCGSWTRKGKGKGWKWTWKDGTVKRDLKAAWHKRTGDSYMVDIKPLNGQVPFLDNVLEVFKYVAKPTQKAGQHVVPWQIVEQLERNTRQKFSNRFGILYREKALAVNSAPETEEEKRDSVQDVNPETVYFASGLYQTSRGRWAFRRLVQVPEWSETAQLFRGFSEFVYRDRIGVASSLCNNSFRRTHDIGNPLPGRLRKGDEAIPAAGPGRGAGLPGRLPSRDDPGRERTVDGIQTTLDLLPRPPAGGTVPKLYDPDVSQLPRRKRRG